MQWADPSSRSLVQALCSDLSSQHVLFVVACRDKEYHTLRVDLLKNCDRSLATSTVVLKGLNRDSVAEFLTSVLGLEVPAADSLANFLTSKTNGNIHHIIQYLKRFRNDGLLFSLSDSSKCHSDILIPEETTANIDDLLHAQVLALDPSIQYIVSVAACIGYRFDIRLLIASVDTQYETNAEALTRQHLTIAQRNGFITQVSRWDYKFIHDKIQQSFYSIIQYFGGREAFHLKIGNALSVMIGTTEKATDALIFLAVDHMNQGSRLITGPEQRMELARLNLLAGKVSMEKVACDRGAQYFRNGIQLLSPASTWTDNYTLTHELHRRLAFAAHCTQDYEESNLMVAEISDNARSNEDVLEAAFITMESLAIRGEHEAGIALTLKVLSMIEFPMAVSPNRVVVALEAGRTRRIVAQYDAEDIASATTAALPSQNALMKALHFLTVFAYYAKRKQKLFSLAILKMIQVTYRDGIGSYSASAFIWYGILQAKLGNTDIADRFFSLGSCLVDTMRASQVAAPALIAAKFGVNHRQKPLVDVYMGLKQTFNASLRFRDSRTSGLGALGQISAAFYCGDIRLAQVEEESRFVVQFMRHIQCGDQLRLALPIVQASVCLQGNAQDPGKLFGNVTDGDRATMEALNDADAPCVELIVGLRLLLALAFEKWSLIQSLIGIPIDTKKYDTPYWTFSFTTFIRGIACLNQYRRTRKRRCLREGLKLKRVLQKLANRNCPGCERKFLLLKAESMSLNSHFSTDTLQKAYTNAIEVPGGCTKSLLDAALANERAALVMMERNENSSARRFAIQAIHCFSQWGATAKVRWLRTQFTNILGGGDFHILDSSEHTDQSVTFGSDSC
jgi:predicted ATPase